MFSKLKNVENYTIGFIGLGIMGRPMALNLVKAGWHLLVFDINRDALNALQQQGATVMNSPGELAAQCEIIISVLPDSPQVLEIAFGLNGLVHGIRPGCIFIDMSTIDVDTIIRIQEKFEKMGVDTLDAPVSGGQVGAEAGTLSVMVGGKRSAFERALPLFQVLGTKISHMGGIGSGQITKSCSQIATALTTQGVVEAFTLAKSAGVDLAKVREALSGGFAQSRALELTGAKMISRDFTPGFKLSLYSKDLRIARSAAAARQLNLPGLELVASEMGSLVQAGSGGLDFSALLQFFENNNNK